MSNNKTHFRKVFKSDHLGVADLEDLIENKNRLVFTIKEVRQEYDVMVAGKKGNFNIAYFNEKIKPLVLNSTNSKQVKKFCNNSPFVEDWKDVIVELYIDRNVKMMGDIVGGVRIKKTQPRKEKPFLTKDNAKVWKRAIEIIKEGKPIDVIKNIYQLTTETQNQLFSEATK